MYPGGKIRQHLPSDCFYTYLHQSTQGFYTLGYRLSYVRVSLRHTLSAFVHKLIMHVSCAQFMLFNMRCVHVSKPGVLVLGTFTSNEYDYLDAQYILVEQF